MIYIGKLRRDRGISVARPTPLGNPYGRERYGRSGALAAYRKWLPLELERNPKARLQLERIAAAALRGDITILCWCTPAACHAEIIRDYIEVGRGSSSVDVSAGDGLAGFSGLSTAR